MCFNICNRSREFIFPSPEVSPLITNTYVFVSLFKVIFNLYPVPIKELFVIGLFLLSVIVTFVAPALVNLLSIVEALVLYLIFVMSSLVKLIAALLSIVSKLVCSVCPLLLLSPLPVLLLFPLF